MIFLPKHVGSLMSSAEQSGCRSPLCLLALTAIKQNALKVPLVIRLTGTNEEIAVKILKENGLSAMTDMDEAVKKAVALATGGKAA